MFYSNPLFGSGWGSYSKYVATTSLGAMYNNLGFTSMSTHNVYLQLLAEIGIVGLALFLVPAAVTLIAAMRRSAAHRGGGLYGESFCLSACVGAQIFFLVYCFSGISSLRSAVLHTVLHVVRRRVCNMRDRHYVQGRRDPWKSKQSAAVLRVFGVPIGLPALGNYQIEDNRGSIALMWMRQKCGAMRPCEVTCPANGGMAGELKRGPLEVLAYKNADQERAKSSSVPPAFWTLAQYTLSGGGVVYGACFDDEFRVVQRRCVTEDEAQACRGSKYSQGLTGTT